MLQYQFRPIDQWPGAQTKARKASQFSAPWNKTLDRLERELSYLAARDVVIQAAVTLDDIRNDGMLRANARPSWPGVILSFASKHGDLSYPCDRFTDWQGNVRAIALALEALRAVNRYGVTRHAEQYKGWAKLPGPSPVTMHQASDATNVLLVAAGAVSGESLNRTNLEEVYRRACVRSHPDAGGSAEAFKAVQEAKQLLDRYFSA